VGTLREPGASFAANYPVALAFAPDGRLFWTERSGTIRYWLNGPQAFATVPVSTAGERGLLGLALSPNFCQDHFVFAFGSDTNGTTQRVVRFTESGGVGTNATVVVGGLPATPPNNPGDCCHKGGRIAFGPDGFLYVTLGDTHTAPALNAQDPCDPRGKVLRYTAGGSPAGVGCGANWVRGLRNPFGIAFAPDGTLGITNNGPSGEAGTPCGSCGDEFYLVGRSGGVDYQWPYCWGYGHPFGASTSCQGLPGPQYSTEGGPYPKGNPFFVAPTGMTYANGHFLFCSYSPGHLYQYGGQGSVADTGVTGCSLDVKQAPSGALFTSDATTIHRH
jgi:glucose/arabinose dehydrogenase